MHTTTVTIEREDSDEMADVQVYFWAPYEFEVADETTEGLPLTKHEHLTATLSAPAAVLDWYIDQAEMRADAKADR